MTTSLALHLSVISSNFFSFCKSTLDLKDHFLAEDQPNLKYGCSRLNLFYCLQPLPKKKEFTEDITSSNLGDSFSKRIITK